MYTLIVVLPLIGFLLAALGGFYFGREGVSLLVCVGQIIVLGCVGLAVYEVIFCNAPVLVHLWDWLLVDGYALSFGLWFDRLTCVMLLIIVTISAAVHVYSVGYMAEDPYATRFMGYLSLFSFFMIVLVTADNFLQMFMGWEGVGLCSYLLINFWHKRVQANKAALKAMIINRIADVLLLLGILLILLTFKTLDFQVVFQLVPLVAQEPLFILGLGLAKLEVIGFFLLLGAVGKSAQLGLHLWLPDAMEGPTPVSALLHAATMVTAGVFLIVRCSFIFEQCPNLLFFMALLGALTS